MQHRPLAALARLSLLASTVAATSLAGAPDGHADASSIVTLGVGTGVGVRQTSPLWEASETGVFDQASGRLALSRSPHKRANAATTEIGYFQQPAKGARRRR